MEGEEESFEKYFSIVRANLSFFIFLGIGVLFLLLGFFFFIQEKNRAPSMTIVTNEATASGKIKIDVEGAVVRPGVYELTVGARIQDGLVAAGGLSGNADREYVAKNINLAGKVTDGAKIYIPRKNEVVSSQQSTVNNQLTNINMASESELDKLYGVGVATAQKIIVGRPYSKIEDLVSKKVLGQSAFEKIKDKIAVY